MEGTPRLYDTLVHVFSPHQSWVDRRHLKTLAWMIVGLIQSGKMGLTAWAPYVHSRAMYAQSTVRRFTRWREHTRLDGHALDGPLLQQALAEWGNQRLYQALATFMLGNTDCLVRLSSIYRGRAMPIVWKVLEHPSRSVAYVVDQEVRDQGVEWRPCPCPVVFTAERGCADTPLMGHLAR
jgi:hypothetical protein